MCRAIEPRIAPNEPYSALQRTTAIGLLYPARFRIFVDFSFFVVFSSRSVNLAQKLFSHTDGLAMISAAKQVEMIKDMVKIVERSTGSVALV